MPVKFLQPLTPPSEANSAEAWIAAGGYDVRERIIELPKCFDCRSKPPGKLLERYRPILIELALSDNRRP